MKLSPKQQKWIKRILILLAIRVVLGGVFYYVVTYRFKDIIQLVVERESKGTYVFDAEDVSLSLWNKSIMLEDAALFCVDSVNNPQRYDVHIPNAYLRIQSWSDLIFHEEIEVDSLAMAFPDIKVHESSLRSKRHLTYHASNVLENLKKMLKHIRVSSFHIHNGSFSYRNAHQPAELSMRRINLQIRDVSGGHNPEDHLLFTDDIDLVLENQHWTFPDGKQQVSFKKLHFSGKQQLFQLDSCTIYSITDKNNIRLTADHLFFNSTRFTAGLQKDALWIDTLVCYQPVLHIETSGNPSHRQPLDTTGISQVGKNMGVFKEAGIGFIDVVSGTLQVKYANRKHHTYTSDKTGVRIFNLSMNGNGGTGLKADSIQLGVKNINFYTTDSMYQITAAELAFEHNDLLLKQASFGPSPFNHQATGLTFTTDALRLNDIDIGYLLNKKLKATGAELEHPTFVLHGKARKQQGSDSLHSIERFYGTLHGIKALIGVDKLSVNDGNLHYTRENDPSFMVDLKGIYARILPKSFLRSDSLINIKHSVPLFVINSVQVTTSKLKLNIDRYTLDGRVQDNKAGHFRLALANGLTLEGQKVNWRKLDWDRLRKEETIDIELLKADKLSIHQKKAISETHQGSHKSIPQLNIGAIEVAHLDIDMVTPSYRLSTKGKDVKIAQLWTAGQHLAWNTIEGTFNQVAFHNDKTDITIHELGLNSYSWIGLKEMKVKSGEAVVMHIPSVKIRCNIPSTNLAEVEVSQVEVDDPDIRITGEADSHAEPKTPTSLPHLFCDDVLVSNMKLTYAKASDSLNVLAKGSIQVKAMHLFPGKGEIAWFDYAILKLNNIKVIQKQNTIIIPTLYANLGADEWSKNKFKGDLHAKWEDADIAIHGKDSSTLLLKQVSGNCSYKKTLIKGQRIAWQSLLDGINISHGQASFRNTRLKASADAVKWDAGDKTAVLGKLHLAPAGTKEETWQKRKYQSDYITFDCDALMLHGLDIQHGKDSLIAVRKIEVIGADMGVARDKRQPFKHGLEKPMPTRMLGSIKYPLQIDSVVIGKTNIMVSQISDVTDELGTIPIRNLKAVIRNIGNRSNDSLYIDASGGIFSTRIRRLHYAESYADTLSSFRLSMNTSKLALTEFSEITVPLASASIANGEGDTLYASWKGNTYAAVGSMNFYYDHLNIKLLPKKADTKPLLLSIENAVANKVVHNSNHSPVQFFYVRDNERFVFNYWVKAEFQGIMASAGIKSSRKFMKQYKRMKKKYRLS